MTEKYYLKLRELYSESLVRDLILFFFLFILIVAQNWDSMLLILFPLILFGYGIFFKVIDIVKKRTEENIIYNPLGSEKKHANRLIFCALFQLILLFWIGAESIYHPQLIDNYFFYFIVLFIFIYTFGFYWLFIDLWKYSRIEILTEGFEQFSRQKLSKDFNNVISFLKMRNFKIISIINFLVFIILNLLNLLLTLFIFYEIMPGITFNLPGTYIEDSKPIELPIIIYGIIVISPLVTTIFLLLSYKDIKDINNMKFNKIIGQLSSDVQDKIKENLQKLNKKIKIKARME